MATKEKLDSIAASKAAIKAAIQEKGVSCDDTLAEYANRIKAIPTGANIEYIDQEAVIEPNSNITFVVKQGNYILSLSGFGQEDGMTYGAKFSHVDVPTNNARPYFIITRLADDGSITYWLAKWQETDSFEVTITVLQEITITQ